MPTETVERRRIRYETLDEVVADVQKLRLGPYSRCGKWSLTQICEHLDKAMEGSMTHMDDVPLGWLIRKTVGKMIFNQMVKSGQMRKGFEAPAAFRPVDQADDDPARIDHFLHTIEKLKTASQFADSPFFGRLTPDEWRAFHLVHAAHHLSHLIPS
ncbi:MAG TPA: DUF1569 domain-containing protein [Candidatus Xenobia bacterium]|jgi:hypothetical protein